MYMAPVLETTQAFSKEIFFLIKEVGNDNTVIWGDWNVVLDVNLDTCNYKRMVNHPRYKNKVKEIMTVHELVDPWREIHPEKRRYTGRKFNTTNQGCLDYFLVSEELLTCIKGANIGSCYRSDHSPVQVEFRTDAMSKGESFQKFNNSLLMDKCYV